MSFESEREKKFATNEKKILYVLYFIFVVLSISKLERFIFSHSVFLKDSFPIIFLNLF